MTLPVGVSKILGKDPGPIIGIVVGVHGNEVAGIRAINDLLKSDFTIQKGALYIIHGNPKAIDKGVRYVDENLNRCFLLNRKAGTSYEYKRAQKLKKVLDLCDVVLDIHATNVKNSKPFVIAERNSSNITNYLPVPIVCRGFDTIEPGGIDYYMNKRRRIGICVECGYLDSDAAYRTAKKSILNFLGVVGFKKGKTKKAKQLTIRAYFLYRSKNAEFNLTKPFKNFEIVSSNQIIGYDSDKPIRAPKKSFIIFAQNRHQKGEECFILAQKS